MRQSSRRTNSKRTDDDNGDDQNHSYDGDDDDHRPILHLKFPCYSIASANKGLGTFSIAVHVMILATTMLLT